MFKTLQRSTITLLAAATATVTIAAVGVAPAAAWQNDYPYISTPTADFGDIGLTVFGPPAAPGTLYWAVPFGIVLPQVTGKLFATNLGGVRLRMRMEYYNAGYLWIANKDGGIVTPPSDALKTWNVNLQEGSGAMNIYFVHVAIMKESVSGSGIFDSKIGQSVHSI